MLLKISNLAMVAQIKYWNYLFGVDNRPESLIFQALDSRQMTETCEKGGVPEWLKGTGCKPVGVRLRWFESNSLHQRKKRKLRVSYIGITLAFQANEVGSIPITRSMWLGTCSPSSVGRALPW